MAKQSLLLKLPADLYKRIQHAAARSDRPVDAVVVETLSILFGDPPADVDAEIGKLDTYTDEKLWAVVYQRMTWADEARLRDLIARGKKGALTREEQTELETLLDKADRYTLLRSRALLLLKQRGHDVDRFLGLSA